MNIYPGPMNGDRLEYELANTGIPADQRSDWPLPSFDARDWASAFCERNHGADESVMIAWFANALMRGFDEGVARAANPPQPRSTGQEPA
jgi:hypothetical protein